MNLLDFTTLFAMRISCTIFFLLTCRNLTSSSVYHRKQIINKRSKRKYVNWITLKIKTTQATEIFFKIAWSDSNSHVCLGIKRFYYVLLWIAKNHCFLTQNKYWHDERRFEICRLKLLTWVIKDLIIKTLKC